MKGVQVGAATPGPSRSVVAGYSRSQATAAVAWLQATVGRRLQQPKRGRRPQQTERIESRGCVPNNSGQHFDHTLITL